MTLIAAIDAIGILFFAIAAVSLFKIKVFKRNIKLIILSLITSGIIYHALIFVQWSGISENFEIAEDVLSIIYLMSWALLFYAILQDQTEKKLHNVNQHILDQQQQLNASYQQLTAQDQQLRAANQQLTAQDQQLRAANQQMDAANQQLRAMNQQLLLEEKKIENENQKLLDIIEFLPDATFVIDKDKKIIAWNRALEEMTGVLKKDIIGKGDYAYSVAFYGEKRPIMVDLLGTEHSEVEKRYDYVHRHDKTFESEVFIPSLYKGSGAHVIIKTSPLYDTNGNAIGAIESIRDVTEQKQAHNKIVQSENLLNSVGDIAKIGGWEMDLENNGKSLWTKATYDIVEIPPDKPIPDINEHINYYLPEYRELVKKKIDDLIQSKEPMNFEAKLRTRTGKLKWAHAYGEVVEKDGKVVKIRGTFQDITERKHAEEIVQAINSQLRSQQQQLQASNQQLKATEQEIIKSRKLYQEVFEGSIDGFVVYDVINSGNDFIIKQFNSGAEKIENISREDVIGKNVVDVFPGVEGFGLLDVFKRVYKTGHSEYTPVSFYEDQRIAGWRDNYVFKLESGEIVASYRDITEQKQAEQSLKFQAMLLDQIQDHVIATDLQGRITYVNNAVMKRMSMTREQLVGKKINALGENPDLGATQQEILEQTLSKNQWHGEVVNKSADGQEFILDCRTYSIYDLEGKRKGLCSISKDITQRKKNEHQLKLYQQQLRDLINRLDIAEQKQRKKIASRLHDDICQDMVLMKMNIDSALSKGNDNTNMLTKMSKDIADILGDLHNITDNLSNHLLDQLGLKTALKEWLSKEVEKKHDIKITFSCDQDYNDLDNDLKDLLFRSTKELLMNVIKHAKADNAKVSIKQNNNIINVEVQDNGIGVKASKNKTSSSYKKGGYGLFSIKERLNYFGGDIRFTDENAPGTRVKITLPIAAKKNLSP